MVTIGYYNGGEIARLSDDLCPSGDATLCEDLEPVMMQLESAQLDVSIHKKTSPYQITLRAERSGLLVKSDELWRIAEEAVRGVENQSG